MHNQAELIKGTYTGFVDASGISLENYQPKLLVNNVTKRLKVLTSITRELRNCDAFFISVAFITQSGVTALLTTLQELESKGIKGKIIASQYLNFTQPKALKRLTEFKNIEVRVVTDGNLHSKGYIFKNEDIYSLIVGSSNLTQNALSYNKEWNLKVSSMEKGSLVLDTLAEFEKTFEEAVEVNDVWIAQYNKIYKANKEFQQYINQKNLILGQVAGKIGAESSGQYVAATDITKKVMPNSMQVNALQGIEEVRGQGETKALVVSATGTGKTYLSAFDVRKVRPQKFLFLAHREQILDQSIESYKKVLGEDIDCGKLCSNSKDVSATYIFSTVQSMSRDYNLSIFSRTAFDYIVIDESHRVGAESYQKIMKYFNPKFLLGMTATPERTDQHNICQDFNYNIAYEIRLQEALEENMLCPFHYFGVTDINVGGIEIEDNTEFKYLVSDERVKHIIDKIDCYGYYGESVKGLIFCSTIKEAKELSNKFNDIGYRTLALSGKDNQEIREAAIKRLELDSGYNKLDYLFTVDIFNEGVDIPSINQIVMLRPTQSAIIFVQQLGRGLRKTKDKEYVVVLDFIGNYSNNFMIPMALSDDRSYNKDTVRRYTAEGSRIIPGCSTINFDEIAKKKIYEAIDNVNFNSVKYMKESYKNLKFRLGHIPTLMDFEEHDAMDLAVLFSGKIGSYHEFLVKYEDEYSLEFDDVKTEIIRFISKKLAIGKRPHELLVIDGILQGKKKPLDSMKERLENEYRIEVKDKTVTNVYNMLTNEFATGVAKKTFENCIFLDDKEVSYEFAEMLKEAEFKKVIKELVDYGLFRNEKYYGNRYKSSALSLYQKYSYEDVCRILEWENGEVSLNIGGYKYDQKSATYPVFINYHKEDDIEASIKYEDRFISQSRLIAISKSGRTIGSNDIQTALKSKALGVSMELFVRKNKDDKMSKEFYYLGSIQPTGDVEEIVMEEAGKKAVEIMYHLDMPVREDIFEYITEG